jgi:hypothetical protein
MHVKESEHWGLLSDVAFECLATNHYSPEAEALLRSTRSRLDRIGWKVVSAAETSYRLAIAVARKQDERVGLEINFDKQGLVSSVRRERLAIPSCCPNNLVRRWCPPNLVDTYAS